MRLPVLLASTELFTSTLAHWNYDRLIHKGAIVGDYYTYIRRTTNSNSPITDLTSPDFRCNAGGASGTSTQTYTIQAGDEIGFMINTNFGHPGPQQVYISKAPGKAADYDGSGSWTKIYAASTKAITDQGLQWATDGIGSFLFNIPAQTPPGEYLVRAEGLALHGASTKGGAQWYIGCAQINVQGSGSGTLSPSVKFPGAYSPDDKAILINLYWPTPTSYTVPGPALWPAGTQVQSKVKTL